VLLGVTGSARLHGRERDRTDCRRRSSSPNKTLAAQLFAEFRSSSRERVEYFVSYYDYYQPSLHSQQTLHREGLVDQRPDRSPAHAATHALLTRAT